MASAAHSIWTNSIKKMEFGTSEQQPIRVLNVPDSPATSLAYDMHFEFEVGIVLSGKMRREYPGGWTRTYSSGEIWFHSLWEPHGWCVPEEHSKYLVLMIWPPLIMDLHFPEALSIPWMAPFTAYPQERPQVDSSARNNVLKIGHALLDCREPKTERDFLHLRFLTLELMALCLGNPRSRHNVSPHAPLLTHNLSPAIAMVFESHNAVRIPEAAAACGMSVASFNRLFRETMGIPFAQFALRRRLNCVANELASTDEPLKLIAAHWGFSDPSHLCRAFAQNYKCTPAEYRIRTRG